MAAPPKDFPMLPIAPPLATLTSLKLEPTDVFVCSWPKSGTTWMQAIVAHLLVDGFKHVSEVTPFYDVVGSWEGEAPSPALVEKFASNGRRCWNTHLLWSLLPKGDSAVRYIYVTRDGRDALVSFWHHLTNQRGDGGTLNEPIGSFLDGVISGTQPYGSWASHITDWSAAFEDPRVLVISYEQMKADLLSVVGRVAEHVGADRSRVEAVAARCTFEQMRKDRALYEPVTVEWAPGFQFLRAGRTGDYKSEFDDEMRSKFEEDAERVLGKDLKERFLGSL